MTAKDISKRWIINALSGLKKTPSFIQDEATYFSFKVDGITFEAFVMEMGADIYSLRLFFYKDQLLAIPSQNMFEAYEIMNELNLSGGGLVELVSLGENNNIYSVLFKTTDVVINMKNLASEKAEDYLKIFVLDNLNFPINFYDSVLNGYYQRLKKLYK